MSAESETIVAASDEAEGFFWLELREPGCVPERKGKWPPSQTASILREFMKARPKAFITVVTWDASYGAPVFQDAPECLGLLDMRSLITARRHIASSNAAFAVSTGEERDGKIREPERDLAGLNDDYGTLLAQSNAYEIERNELRARIAEMEAQGAACAMWSFDMANAPRDQVLLSKRFDDGKPSCAVCYYTESSRTWRLKFDGRLFAAANDPTLCWMPVPLRYLTPGRLSDASSPVLMSATSGHGQAEGGGTGPTSKPSFVQQLGRDGPTVIRALLADVRDGADIAKLTPILFGWFGCPYPEAGEPAAAETTPP